MPVWVSLGAFIYTFIASWNPSFWFDEAATVSAINRAPDELWRMLSNIDAVHGAYYFLLQSWANIFGLSEISLRLPSVIAITLSTGILFSLVRRLVRPEPTLIASLLFVVLPRIQYMGIDARSYALSTLTVLLATYLLILIREHPKASLWVGYMLCGIASTLLSFYTVFMLVVHAGYILIDHKLREQLLSFLGASLAWAVPAGSIAAISSNQRFQISWIPKPGEGTIIDVFFVQFFNDSYYFKDSAFSPPPIFGEIPVMFILGAFVWILAVIGIIKQRNSSTVWLGVLWALGPPVIALLISWLLNGAYYIPRYCSFAIPGIALLASLAFARQPQEGNRTSNVMASPRSRLIVALMIVLTVTPTYLGQRTIYGKSPDDNFRFIAETLQEKASSGEAFILHGKYLSPAPRGYPDTFQKLKDLTLEKTAVETKGIYDQRFPVTESQEKITPSTVVWAISQESNTEPLLESWGYTATEQYIYNKTTITKFQKK